MSEFDPNPDGWDTLVVPFLFVPDGAHEPVEWLAAHPDYFRAGRASLIRRPAIAGPRDKRGNPWPRDRWGNPMCPLDELPQGTVAPGTAPYEPYNPKSPWFDPVRTLQKIGCLPADLRGYAHRVEPGASASATAPASDQEPRQETSAGDAALPDPHAAGPLAANAHPLVPDSPSDAARVLPVATADVQRSADPAGSRAGSISPSPEEEARVARADPPIRPVYPVEALLGLLAGGAPDLLPRALAAISKQFLPDYSWVFGTRPAEPSSNPAPPEASLPPVRSADLDQSAWQAEQEFIRRRANALDESHLSAAEGDLRGQFVRNPRTGQAYNHLQEVRDAQRGLRNAVKGLEDKIRHYEQYVRPVPRGSIADATRLLNRIGDFLKYTERRVPRDVQLPEGP